MFFSCIFARMKNHRYVGSYFSTNVLMYFGVFGYTL